MEFQQKNIWDHMGANWQQGPVRVAFDSKISAEEIFGVFRKGAALYREGKVPSPAKIFTDGINRQHELHKYLPTEGEGFLEYDHRIMEEYGHTTYLVYVFDMSPYDANFRDTLAALKRQIAEGSGQQSKWGTILGEVFLGRYRSTTGGIHKEVCASFQYVLHGHKLMRIWPENTWDVNVEKVRPSNDERTGDQEYYLPEVGFDEKQEASTDLIGQAGDVFYWPEGWWHVGRSEGLTCSLTIALYPAQEKPTETHE